MPHRLRYPRWHAPRRQKRLHSSRPARLLWIAKTCATLAIGQNVQPNADWTKTGRKSGCEKVGRLLRVEVVPAYAQAQRHAVARTCIERPGKT
jgi:hypothetical protein